MEIQIERFATGPLETNTYVVAADNHCLIFDPSSGCDAVLRHVQDHSLQLDAVCLTHGHFDHIMGIEEVMTLNPRAPLVVHALDLPLLQNAEFNGSWMIGGEYVCRHAVQTIDEGPLKLGMFDLQVFFIGGHSPGGCGYLLGRHLLCGDALFAGSVGRTDLPGGDGFVLLENIRLKFFTLPDDTIVYPGHGNRTTVGREKRTNPFFAHG